MIDRAKLREITVLSTWHSIWLKYWETQIRICLFKGLFLICGSQKSKLRAKDVEEFVTIVFNDRVSLRRIAESGWQTGGKWFQDPIFRVRTQISLISMNRTFFSNLKTIQEYSFWPQQESSGKTYFVLWLERLITWIRFHCINVFQYNL